MKPFTVSRQHILQFPNKIAMRRKASAVGIDGPTFFVLAKAFMDAVSAGNIPDCTPETLALGFDEENGTGKFFGHGGMQRDADTPDKSQAPSIVSCYPRFFALQRLSCALKSRKPYADSEQPAIFRRLRAGFREPHERSDGSTSTSGHPEVTA